MIRADFFKKLAASCDCRRVVFHVARDPRSGVWALMNNLVAEQEKEPGVFAGFGVMFSRDWPASYHEQLERLAIPVVSAPVPFHSYSAAFAAFIVSNPLRGWIRRIREIKPQAEIVVHCHNAWLAGGFFPLPLDGNSCFVTTIHGVADEHRFRKIWWLRTLHRYFSRRLCRYDAQVTSVSEEGVGRIERILGIPADRIRVIANGMPDHGILRTFPADRPFLVGHVGQLHPGKGWQFLLEAVDQLRREKWNIELVIAGIGPDENAIREAAASRPYLHFRGLVPDAGKCVIPELSALVLATWSEGMPMAVLEAFCAGVPVLSTAVGGLPEMVVSGENGEFIERNCASIADKLRNWLGSSNEYERCRVGARKFFREHYEISLISRQYAGLYSELLKKDCR